MKGKQDYNKHRFRKIEQDLENLNGGITVKK